MSRLTPTDDGGPMSQPPHASRPHMPGYGIRGPNQARPPRWTFG
jgi:hypothetical protein